MEMNIPIYVETLPTEGRRPPRFRCEPLFAPKLYGESEVLSRATTLLVDRLKRQLDRFGRHGRHDALAAAAYHPVLESHAWKFRLDLRDRTLDCRYLFVIVEGLDRRIAFCPRLPDLWVDIENGEDPYQRVAESLEAYFRRLKKDEPGMYARLAAESLRGKAWVTSVDLDVRTRQPTRKEVQKKLALLFDETEVDGEDELERVGRNLDRLYPDDLQRAVGRDCEVARLVRLLSADDRRPVLLVGRHLAGKTTVLHECVHRRVSARTKFYSAKQNVWLISPGRLISGMSYVGQWENRWLAILDEVKKRDHVLYFDDLLGMYHAGISRDSNLCAADVLKPRVRRREVRIVAELTPEALHRFQERDRGFADEFQILPIEETDEAATLRVLLEVGRRLEARHRCRFSLDAIPSVTEIQRRYAPGAAFPGKAARMLTRLAVKHANSDAEVSRAGVLREFHDQTGLQLALLDTTVRLPREQILARLRERMVGQQPALDAAADVIAVAKARLNALDRPLGVLLFLGPTGVGKTECAKAIARYLYGDADKLLRLDMNEFVTAADAARLVGTFGREDGLLTGPVRRRPFSVVLLDEIEKAHPDVHNLLLQLTGEGRLTDALGRTADFSGTIVVLTSNLGTREAARSTGYAAARAERDGAGDHHYVKAAERFFSPELFNRFDRVVPFSTLARDELRQIAEHLMRDVFRRDGLIRRRVLLHVAPAAIERVIDEGYHPRYGARALKRSVERRIARPVGRQLASLAADRPTMVRIFGADDGIVSFVDELTEVERAGTTDVSGATDLSVPSGRRLVPGSGDNVSTSMTADAETRGDSRPLPGSSRRPKSTDKSVVPSSSESDVQAATITGVHRRIESLREAIADLKPAGGISVGSLSQQDYRYFALREQFETVAHQLDAIERSLEDEYERIAPPMISSTGRRGGRKAFDMGDRGSPRQFLVNLYSTNNIEEFLEEATSQTPDARSGLDLAWRELHGELALLEAMAASPDSADKVALIIRLVGPNPSFRLRNRPVHSLAAAFQLDCSRIEVQSCIAYSFSGAFAELLVRPRQGLHLIAGEGDELSALEYTVLPVAEEASFEQAVEQALAREAEWQRSLTTQSDRRRDEPFPPGQVVAVYQRQGAMTDLRSGTTLPANYTIPQLRSVLLAAYRNDEGAS